LPTADHPFSGIMNAGRKVVFSRTLKTAEWANTTIAAGETAEEIDKLRQGGDGHIVVWGGVGFWRSLMRLDLIDEFRLDLHPYVAKRSPVLRREQVVSARPMAVPAPAATQLG
jgi:dihydrofolate reductase